MCIIKRAIFLSDFKLKKRDLGHVGGDTEII